MDLKVFPSKLHNAVIAASPSKSYSQRAILTAAMAVGDSTITNLLASPDIDAMLQACSKLGAKIVRVSHNSVVVSGVAGRPHITNTHINVAGSGQVLRFIAAVALCVENTITLDGDRSVRSLRSMADLTGGLKQLGIRVSYTNNDGFAPVTLSGKLKPGCCRVHGADSQVVSALLLASSYLAGNTTIMVDEPGEVPWVHMTVQWLLTQGVKVTNKNFKVFKIQGKPRRNGICYNIPGDFSSAAYPATAATLFGRKLTLQGLSWQDCQGDKMLFDILADFTEKKNFVVINDTTIITSIDSLTAVAKVNVNNCIDMITIVAILALYANGTTHISGAAIARSKESDRITSMVTELKKMGAQITEVADGMIIHGGKLVAAKLDSCDDHRVAMALFVAALGATSPSIIKNASCINKSYPGFLADMAALGAKFVQL